MSTQQPGADQTHTEVADRIAAAALAVPGVAGLHSGRFGEVATYLPGRRVLGVRLGPDVVEVHVSIAYPAPVLETANRIHTAVGPLAPSPLEVTIEDIVGPDADPL